MSETIKAPTCAGCGGGLLAWHCETCRTTNGAVRGVLGEDMPGADWTGLVDLGPIGDVRLDPRMRCAVSTDEDGPHAWTQVAREGPSAGQWYTQGHGGTAGVIFGAWGLAMLARAKRAEWLIDGLKRPRGGGNGHG